MTVSSTCSSFCKSCHLVPVPVKQKMIEQTDQSHNIVVFSNEIKIKNYMCAKPSEPWKEIT